MTKTYVLQVLPEFGKLRLRGRRPPSDKTYQDVALTFQGNGANTPHISLCTEQKGSTAITQWILSALVFLASTGTVFSQIQQQPIVERRRHRVHVDSGPAFSA